MADRPRRPGDDRDRPRDDRDRPRGDFRSGPGGPPPFRRSGPGGPRPGGFRAGPGGPRPGGFRSGPGGFRPSGPRPQGRPFDGPRRDDRPPYDAPRPEDARPPFDGPRRDDRPSYGGPRRDDARPPYNGPRRDSGGPGGGGFGFRGGDRDRPRFDRPRPEGPRSFDRPREDGPRSFDGPRSYDGPRPPRPEGDRPRFDRPRFDRPRTDGPRSFDGPRGPRPGGFRPGPAPRPGDWQERPPVEGPRFDRPPGEAAPRRSLADDERDGPRATWPHAEPREAREPGGSFDEDAALDAFDGAGDEEPVRQRREPGPWRPGPAGGGRRPFTPPGRDHRSGPWDRDRRPRPEVGGMPALADDEELVAGRRPVEEAFVARREAKRLYVVPQRRMALEKLVLHATNLRIPVVEVEGGSLTAIAGFDGHQGIALVVAPRRWASQDDILAAAKAAGQAPLVLVLDSLEDPQNVGTLLRSAEASGVHGAIFPTRNQAPLTPAAVKASAGAVEHLRLAPVDDLPAALADLHIRGLRIVGADGDAQLTAREADLRGPIAIVVGSEGKGLGPAVRRRCDLLVRIPMHGKIESLNASVAGSILLYEAAAQRGLAERPAAPHVDTPVSEPADEAATHASAPLAPAGEPEPVAPAAPEPPAPRKRATRKPRTMATPAPDARGDEAVAGADPDAELLPGGPAVPAADPIAEPADTAPPEPDEV